ncbi:MAG: CHRD domain-containing protein [Candidatus Eisenbacteria bacterium]|nr:CHRD domain-containing protein [Candidatus Eisenbacteria bacterium]
MKKYALTAATAIAMISLIAGMSYSGGKPFYVSLNGATEVPGPGDPDGTGTFDMSVNPGSGEICYTLSWTAIDPATAAHIHLAPAGEAGPVVVALTLSGSNSTTRCVSVDRELARNIIRNPGSYYVNVHNVVYPSGAIRAQLTSDDDDKNDDDDDDKK